MKKLLALVCLLALTGCGSEVDIISLEKAQTLTETALNAELIGKTDKDIHSSWGKPDEEDSELPVEKYYIEGASIRITYDFYDMVEKVQLIDAYSDTFIHIENYDFQDIESFSFEKILKQNEKTTDGVIREGFKNSSPVTTDAGQMKIDEAYLAGLIAQKEVTIEFNAIEVARDDDAKMWEVLFYTKGALGGIQTVYLDDDGVTHLIIYGE